MKTLKKVLSGALCALIAMLAPGIGAYQAAAQDMNARAEIPSGIAMPLAPASIGLQMQNIGDSSAENFLDASFSKDGGDLIQALPQNVVKRVANASQNAEIKSAPKLTAVKSLSAPKKFGTAIQKTAKSFAAKFKKIHAAVSQKVSDSISDKISGFTRLFDGSKLAPAYAMAGASSFNFAARKQFVLGNYLSQAAGSTSNGSAQAEPPAPGTPITEANLPGVYQGNFVVLDVRDRFTLVLNADKTFSYYGIGAYTNTMGKDFSAEGTWAFADGKIQLHYAEAPVQAAPYALSLDVSRQTLESLKKGVASYGSSPVVPMDVGLYDGKTFQGVPWSGLQKTDESPLWIKIKRAMGLSPIPGSFRRKIKEDIALAGVALATLAADMGLAKILVRLRISDFMKRASARFHAVIQWVKTHAFGQKTSANEQSRFWTRPMIIGAATLAVALGAGLVLLMTPFAAHAAPVAALGAAHAVGHVLLWTLGGAAVGTGIGLALLAATIVSMIISNKKSGDGDIWLLIPAIILESLPLIFTLAVIGLFAGAILAAIF